MNRVAGAIRTPDQRLRMFVSSTLGELAKERRAVRMAIEALRLTPVMFELGVCAHPPLVALPGLSRPDDIFLGIYWERYGWVAPAESISGLEDESHSRVRSRPEPHLYQGPRHRDGRLGELIDRIRTRTTPRTRRSPIPRSSSALITEDLAAMLSERFRSGSPRPRRSLPPRVPLGCSPPPARPPPIVGRRPGSPTELFGPLLGGRPTRFAPRHARGAGWHRQQPPRPRVGPLGRTAIRRRRRDGAASTGHQG